MHSEQPAAGLALHLTTATTPALVLPLQTLPQRWSYPCRPCANVVSQTGLATECAPAGVLRLLYPTYPYVLLHAHMAATPSHDHAHHAHGSYSIVSLTVHELF